MVIHFGEAQVLKWQVAEPLDGFVGGELSLPDIFKERT
jgi:hypothetical protein